MTNLTTAAAMASVARLGAYDFLRRSAPHLWASMIARGVDFLIPPEIPAHLDPPILAARLATAEANRLRGAETYFVTDSAVQSIMNDVQDQLRNGGGYELSPTRMPEPKSGFLLWGSWVTPGADGSHITAVHWEKRKRNVWVAWWTNTAALLLRRVDAGEMSAEDAEINMNMHGPLTYEREQLLPYGRADALKTDNDLQTLMISRITMSTWRTLATPGLTHRVAIPADERSLLAAVGLPPDPVWVLDRQ